MKHVLFLDPTKIDRMIVDEADEVLKNSNEININYLNDESLVCIFKYLPMFDKLKIEAVCKKWQNLSIFSWSNENNLRLCWSFLVQNRLTEASKDFATRFTINIIKKCGTYINSLTIFEDSKLELLILFKSISKYCKNIRKITIFESFIQNNKKFNDSLLELLCISNPNICNICLGNVNLKGSCFISLNLEKIEEIKVSKSL